MQVKHCPGSLDCCCRNGSVEMIQDQIIKLAMECGASVYNLDQLQAFYRAAYEAGQSDERAITRQVERTCEALEKRIEALRILAETSYEQGQRDMREASAQKAEDWDSYQADPRDVAEVIRALPIGEQS